MCVAIGISLPGILSDGFSTSDLSTTLENSAPTCWLAVQHPSWIDGEASGVSSKGIATSHGNITATATRYRLHGSQLACDEALVAVTVDCVQLHGQSSTALQQPPFHSLHDVSMDSFISAMAMVQDVPCAAMLVEGCNANICMFYGTYKLMFS